MAVEAVILALDVEWMHVFLVLAVMLAIVAPEALRRTLDVSIPSEIQLLASLFIFASVFLGEVRDFYERIWWWDVLLHGTAGLLLGLLGFIIVFVLNQSERIQLQMRPSFVALFAFFFSVGLGGLWEIFEFGMDQAFGLTMQKPIPGDPSGLSDTMRDLIVDTLGAGLVSLAGWRYLKGRHRRYVDTWVGRMIRRRRRGRPPRQKA